MFWAGWVVSILPAIALVPSAVFKFIQPADMAKELARLGWQGAQMPTIGVVELVCTALYLIPQTAVLGAILLTGYLGGAIATHVRISDNFVPPVIIGVLVWLGLFLRDPRVRALIPIRRTVHP
jgi:xanthine/uracil permease